MKNKELEQIESSIWSMANDLRGNMDASEYKNYILPFMFYRFLSEKQSDYLVKEDLIDVEEGQNPAEAAMDMLFGTTDLKTIREYATNTKSFTDLYVEKTDQDGKPVMENGHVVTVPKADWVEDYIEFVKECASSLGYCISPLYDWYVVEKMVNEDGIRPSDFQDMFDSFNASLKFNEQSRSKIEGIFNDVNLGSAKLGNTTNERAKALSKIIGLVSHIPYSDDSGKDILGQIYEYLIKQFAATAGKKGGEFYTPHEVSTIMSKIVTNGYNQEEGFSFSVFDPTCGSGSLLLTVGKELPGEKKEDSVTYYGQELNTSTYNLARMNMMMNNVRYDCFTIRNADTLGTDWPDGIGPDGKDHLRRFDAIVANPPYSQKWDAPDSYLKDPRFREYGGKLAPKSKADYAFLLDGLYHLNVNGTMAIVLPHGVLFRGAAEESIRKTLIEKNLIDTVIGLPANLFYGTSIPTIIMVLKKNKKNRDILFIDASQHFTKSKNKNTLSEEDIDRIFNTYKDRKDVEKLAHVASYQEVIDNDYNLNIPRYVDTSDEEPEIDLKEVEKQIKEVDQEIAELQEKINEQLRLLGVIQ